MPRSQRDILLAEQRRENLEAIKWNNMVDDFVEWILLGVSLLLALFTILIWWMMLYA
jgi:hypothetical protein